MFIVAGDANDFEKTFQYAHACQSKDAFTLLQLDTGHL